MSYVISVRRPRGKPKLTVLEVAQRLESSAGFSRLSESSWAWALADGKQATALSFVAGELSVESGSGREAEARVEMLRELAESLEAVVYGEEGEELSGFSAPTKSASQWSVLGGLVLVVVMLPFMALLAILRLPWLIWKLLRAAK